MNPQGLRLVDSHCHLCLEEFSADLEQVLLRAEEAGVTRIVVPGIDLETSRRAVQMAQANPQLFAAVGVHPHNASEWSPALERNLLDLAQDNSVTAIGEIGLDYYRQHSPRTDQHRALEAQLALAASLGLPVIVHNREAIDDLLAILLPWSGKLPAALSGRAGVLHAFSASSMDAAQATEAGFFLGIAGPLTFRNAESARSLASELPLPRILVETDSPYLSPHPYRGERNEPSRVSLVVEALARVQDVDTKKIAEQTTANAAELFSWDHGFSHSDLL